MLSRTINPSTPQGFGEICSKSDVSWLESAPLTADPDELLTVFNSICSEVWDSVAHYKIKHRKVNHQPWLNEYTCVLRQQCRKAEWAWKKNKLLVSHQILRGSLIGYQKAVKDAKAAYFSNITQTHPKFCFNLLIGFLIQILSQYLHLQSVFSGKLKKLGPGFVIWMER